MTTRVETPHEGRDRGLTDILRTWVAVVVHPYQFFHGGVVPGDQTLGLASTITVALVYQGLGSVFKPATISAVEGGPLVSVLVALLVVALFVASALFHLMVVIQTALLVPPLSYRVGVSETMQVTAYAAVPCAFASLPTPGVRAPCVICGAVLLAVGIGEVHQIMAPKTALAAAVPAGVVSGYAFGGFRALSELAAVLAFV